ncbi:polysaccharide biosynthesis tyrosine autokinase [Pedobacter agri]|uniref:GumC family protein n=1 Tax=Pedobacter agri TaxID=454586 RepID=UPI00292FBF67|nr:polysaccharide biosynthesis tyrosine autokinase [Pedobacter agri]
MNANNRIENTLEEEGIDFKRILGKLIEKWHWFLISTIILLVASLLYIRFTPPTYRINAKLLVNDGDGGGASKQASALMDLGGIIGGKNSVDNEIEVLKTRFLMEQVVRQMQLNVVYAKHSRLVDKEIYNKPFIVNIVKGVDSIKRTELHIECLTDGRFKITGDNFDSVVKYSQRFKVDDLGILEILPASDQIDKLSGHYTVAVSSVDDRAGFLMSKFTASVSNKLVTVIDLSMSYPVEKKGEDILNSLIRQYIKSNLEDKNIIADSTTAFIQKRLSIIAGELGDVENNVESFKEGNRLADMTEQGKLLVQNSSSFINDLAKAETQVTILSDLESYLEDDTKNKRVFPSSLIPADMVFSDLMREYNSLLIERDRQLLSVTEESPFIQNIDKQIFQLRQGILANIKSSKNTFLVTRDKLRKQVDNLESKIYEVPKIEKDYLKLARNQKIKEELYIFLMQKAEETAISKTSNIPIAKTIDPPKAYPTPISPKKNMVVLVAFVLGILIPYLILFLKDLFDTKIKSKEDIRTLTSIPIFGEISHNDDGDSLVVAHHSRSSISEQFRALRTNLSFYLKNEDQKVILLTSSMSGEGKSFTAINLANVLALSGKKVLLMELDLRKPGLSTKLGVVNDAGFSTYTIDKNIKIKDIIKPLTINSNMFIMTSGPLPPNPAETLMSEHTPGLIAGLKEQFDYIIMDTPPIGVITDAQLLSEFADVSIYLVRHKVTRKEQLQIVQDLFTSNKMKNLGIVVNDIYNKHYGYGYGYGNYGQESNLSKFEKIKRKFKG